MAVVLDAGALIAVDRRDRAVGAMLARARAEHIPVRTSAAVVAQVWRNGRDQANLVRVLNGIEAVAMDPPTGRRIGELLAASRTSDVVDGHLCLTVNPGDVVVTSDPIDIRRLLRARKVSGIVHTV